MAAAGLRKLHECKNGFTGSSCRKKNKICSAQFESPDSLARKVYVDKGLERIGLANHASIQAFVKTASVSDADHQY